METCEKVKKISLTIPKPYLKIDGGIGIVGLGNIKKDVVIIAHTPTQLIECQYHISIENEKSETIHLYFCGFQFNNIYIKLIDSNISINKIY